MADKKYCKNCRFYKEWTTYIDLNEECNHKSNFHFFDTHKEFVKQHITSPSTKNGYNNCKHFEERDLILEFKIPTLKECRKWFKQIKEKLI